jgi:hypothetical protein
MKCWELLHELQDWGPLTGAQLHVLCYLVWEAAGLTVQRVLPAHSTSQMFMCVLGLRPNTFVSRLRKTEANVVRLYALLSIAMSPRKPHMGRRQTALLPNSKNETRLQEFRCELRPHIT